MAYLKENYVCTWSLPGELEKLIATSETKHIKTVASRLRANYRPLVEISRLDEQGVIEASLSMNEDILDKFERAWEPGDDAVKYFLDFLRKGQELRE